MKDPEERNNSGLVQQEKPFKRIHCNQIFKAIIGEAEAALRHANFEPHVANIRKLSFLLATRIAQFKGVEYFCPNFGRLHPETRKDILEWAKKHGIRVDADR